MSFQYQINNSIPTELDQLINKELQAGERIVWKQMPIPKYFTPGSKAIFLFAIPWTLFAIFWICAASGFEIPKFNSGFSFFPLFGLPFLFIGFKMLLTPVFEYKMALKTVYVITSLRAIILYGGKKIAIMSYYPNKLNLNNMIRTENSDGTGDVIFTDSTYVNSEGDKRSSRLGFINITNSREAEKKLRVLIETASKF